MEGLDAIQTGILRVKLKHLSDWNEKRRQNASLYSQLLNTAALQHSNTAALKDQHSTLNTVITPYEPTWSKAVYHLYIIRTQKRDELQKYLQKKA